MLARKAKDNTHSRTDKRHRLGVTEETDGADQRSPTEGFLSKTVCFPRGGGNRRCAGVFRSCRVATATLLIRPSTPFLGSSKSKLNQSGGKDCRPTAEVLCPAFLQESGAIRINSFSSFCGGLLVPSGLASCPKWRRTSSGRTSGKCLLTDSKRCAILMAESVGVADLSVIFGSNAADSFFAFAK